MTRKEAHTPNSSLAKWRVTCFYDSFVLNQSAVLRLNFCAENPPLRQAAKRKQPLPIFYKIFFGNLNFSILFFLCFVAAHTVDAQSQTQSKAAVRAATPTHNQAYILLSAVMQNMNDKTFINIFSSYELRDSFRLC